MCGRFTLTDSIENIIFSFKLQNSINFINPRYNIFPSEKIPVILKKDGLNYIEIMRWGLKRFGVNTTISPLINARVETITSKPIFRNVVMKRRCLIPANGFYEWKRYKNKKQPYFISLKNINLFAFAGIYEYGQSFEGENIKTVAIITTASNSFLEKIHNRMPIILTENSFNNWLDYPEFSLSEICKTSKSVKTQAWQVSRKVNSPSFDNPICTKKIIKNDISKEGEKFLDSQGSFFD